MTILVPLLFISFILVTAAVAFFIFSARNKDLTMGDQISLMPLEDDSNAKTNHNL